MSTWASIPAEQVLPGIERQVVHAERQTMVRYIYQPGAVFPIHQHPEEQVTIVLSGRIRFTVDGREMELSAGEFAVIPPNVPHGAAVVGNEVVETYNAMCPRRDVSPLGASA